MVKDFTSPVCCRITEIFDEYTARFDDYLSALNRDMHALKKGVMELLAHQDKSPSKPPERPWTAAPMDEEECEVVTRRAPTTASEDSTDSSWGIANAHPPAQQRALPEVACFRRERHALTSATPPTSSGRGSGHAELWWPCNVSWNQAGGIQTLCATYFLFCSTRGGRTAHHRVIRGHQLCCDC